MTEETVEVTAWFVCESDAAICVREDDNNDVWLPKSQIEYEVSKNGDCTVTLPAWLAEKKGLTVNV